ncbi:MAG: hypothetical protein HeimC3_22360 [Candidatus Heimdallarchaeota archaeon LC_3]|nr:MAG: hypothetical protein HeimC3_22360 [Candidatus Heimdallarchaeota archaeon LC_3]
MNLNKLKNEKLLLSTILVSIFLIISWSILEYTFGFSQYHVYGPGNEFIPLFRYSLLMLILLYPFFNFFLIVNIRIIEKKTKKEIISIKIDKIVLFKFLLWTFIWPGFFLIFGWFLGTIPSLLDPAIPVPHTITMSYWTLFLILGRLGDPIPYIILKVWKFKAVTIKNILSYFGNFLKRVFFDIIIIFLAFTVQFMAFVFPIVLISPFIILSDVIPEISIFFGIIGLFIIVLWPISFLLAYLSILLIRTILQTGNFELFDKTLTRASIYLNKY